MDPGEHTTGTRDEQYNLVSVLYHALHGAETIEAYVLDAEATGDERLAGFFREAQATYRQLAERAKENLGVLEVPPEPGVAPDMPPEGGISPGAMAGGIPPHSADAEMGGTAPPMDTAAPGAPPPGAPDVSLEIPPEGLAEEAQTEGLLPGREPDVPPPGEPRGEPGRATVEPTAATRPEEQEEEKGLLDRTKDKLTEAKDRLVSEEDRPPDRR